ncbi:MAG: HAD-IC family P-type ATPase [Patescibacteria group bacterium]
MYHWYSLSPQTIEKQLSSSLERGLSHEEAHNRLKADGPNQMPVEKTDSFFLIFIRQFQSPLIYLLGAASLTMFALNDPIDGSIILFVLSFNAVLGTIHDGRAQQTLRKLRDFITTTVTVMRHGERSIIPDTELVVGDIILIHEGERIGADARLIECNGLRVDESSVTGESGSIDKTHEAIKQTNVPIADQHSMVFKGTAVVAGSAKAIVVATGTRTEIGKIGVEISHISTEMPLKNEMGLLSRAVIIAAAVICGGIFILGIMKGRDVIQMFEAVVSLSVSVIPEGLPIVLTLILANGVWHMAKRNALVKKLQAVEALGQAEVIAVDKTGTLTKNELIVRKLFTLDGEYDVSGSGYTPEGTISFQGEAVAFGEQEVLEKLIAYSAATSEATIALEEKDQTWKISGEPTEAALTVLAHKVGLTGDSIRERYPIIMELPFNYKEKYHAILTQEDGEKRLIVTGAPEVIIAHSIAVAKNGAHHALNEDIREEIEDAIQRFSRKGLRVIACAYSTHPNLQDLLLLHPSHVERLTFVGLCAIQDTLRDEVPAAIEKAKNAGIRIVMLTGDHINTARAIAQSAGIYHDGDEVLTGPDIERLSSEELQSLLARVTVCARVTPEHKLRLVQGYRSRGEIIAMTGDGVNDAPALVAADLGIAMGKNGTEVAKEASDIILLDDNFSSIIAAVEEGRNIFKTLKKVILYLFSTNLSEVITISLALIIGLPLPLLAAQIIWLNLVTDSFLDVSLSMEPKEHNLLTRNGTTKRTSLVDGLMIQRIILMSLPMALSALFLFEMTYRDNMEKALTLCMTTLAFSQWLNAWNCRSEDRSIIKQFFSNKALLGALAMVVSLQLLAVYHPLLNTILHTVPLDGQDWAMIASLSLFVVVIEEIRKYIARKRLPSYSRLQLRNA